MLCLALFAYRPAPNDPAANVAPVMLAGLGGLAAGAIVAWTLARGVANPWHRATLAMMGVMGAALIGALTMPAHASYGAPGLVGLFVLCLAAMAAAWRGLVSRP